MITQGHVGLCPALYRSWNGTTSLHPGKFIGNGPSAALRVLTSSPHTNEQSKESNQHRNPSSFPLKSKCCSFGHFFPPPHLPTHTHTVDPQATVRGGLRWGPLCLLLRVGTLKMEFQENSGFGRNTVSLCPSPGTMINCTPDSHWGGCISKAARGLPSKDPWLLEGGSYLVGCECENSIQVFYQLLEGGSLWGHRMPAISHHHIPGRDGFPWWLNSLRTRGVAISHS